MFDFLSNFFTWTDKSQSVYPESLVTMAVERAVDATDPRMRILPGYAKSLRAAVIHAIDHVIALVDALPAALPATPQGREASTVLGNLFSSSPRMAELLAQDAALRDFVATSPLTTASELTGLLVVQRNEKQGFGFALVDDKVLNDVQQTTVSFDAHRLLDIATTEAETRRLLKHRAFDYILSVALAHVTEQRDERERLSQQRTLLRCKLDILQTNGSGFSRDMGPQDKNALQTRLQEIENQLEVLGPVHEVLQANLAIVTGILAEAEKHLWLETVNLRIDQRFVLHSEADTSVAAIPFVDICDSDGKRATAQLVQITR